MVIYYNLALPRHIAVARVIKPLESRKAEVNRVWWNLESKEWFNMTGKEASILTAGMMKKGTKKSFVREIFERPS